MICFQRISSNLALPVTVCVSVCVCVCVRARTRVCERSLKVVSMGKVKYIIQHHAKFDILFITFIIILRITWFYFLSDHVAGKLGSGWMA